MDADANPKVKRCKIAIQYYDCCIDYIKGLDNVIADPMSRLVHTNKLGPANIIAALREVPDEFMSLFERDIPLDDTIEHSLYMIKHNQFYPQAVREFQISPTVKAEIEAVHNAVAGHHGVQATFDKLVRRGKYWPYMREHVKYFIETCCPFC